VDTVEMETVLIFVSDAADDLPFGFVLVYGDTEMVSPERIDASDAVPGWKLLVADVFP
jgi:hypothetical protein